MSLCKCCHTDSAALREENETLAERLRQALETLKAQRTFPPQWGLTPHESDILSVLAERGTLTAQDYMDRRRQIGPERQNATDDHRVLQVYVYKIRRKLKPLAIEIQSWWGRGYWLDEASRAKVRAAMVGA